ncbi:hypothetical protein LJC01_01420 [Clostridiaceae bacterium OttesenSCG-928-D20]|nr:hypothetical protein [Clostridiaceae bacterium OttesenSCG-928-D20]
MSLFSKAEYKDLMLPFRFIEEDEDLEGGMLSIECYGAVFDEYKYCYASYIPKKKEMYENGEYESLVQILRDNSSSKPVRLTFKLKNDKPKDFKLDLESLADACGDERLKTLELCGWGLNDKSFRDIEA